MNIGLPVPVDPSLALGSFGEFDYTFTDKELEDVLGFMERQHGRAPGDPFPPPPPTLPFLAPGTTQAPLQFQPHMSAQPLPLDGHGMRSVSLVPFDYGLVGGVAGYDPGRASPFLPSESPGLGVKLELLDSPQHGQRGAQPGAMFAPAPPEQLGTLPSHYPSGLVPQSLGPSPAAHRGVEARPYPAQQPPRKDGRPHISHSTVEKQRRDRINSLIDELRDLVPPQPGSESGPGTDSSDSRRPKHVVLADTIQLVRDLQEKVTLGSSRGHARRPGASSTSVSVGGGEGEGLAGGPQDSRGASDVHRELSSNSQRSADSHPELPQAPDDALAIEEGVVVEAVDDTFYVKVHCKDRAGLLADIVRALKLMPLEISSAAVTTTRHGMVCDVFQVRLERGETVTLTEIREAVSDVVFDSVSLGEKKRRAVE